MKIGDKIIIDKDFYINKFKETFGENVQIDGLTNDNEIDTYIKKAIKNRTPLEITDIDANVTDNFGVQYFIHLKDDEEHDGCLDIKYIKIPNDDLDLSDILLKIVNKMNMEYQEKRNLLSKLEESVIRKGKNICDYDLKNIHCLYMLVNNLKKILNNE